MISLYGEKCKERMREFAKTSTNESKKHRIETMTIRLDLI